MLRVISLESDELNKLSSHTRWKGQADVYARWTSMPQFDWPLALKAFQQSNSGIEVGDVEECDTQKISKFAVTEATFLELQLCSFSLFRHNLLCVAMHELAWQHIDFSFKVLLIEYDWKQ